MTEGNMKTPAFFFITALVALSMSACVLTGGTTATTRNSDLVTLENSALSMTIRKSPAPHIFRLVHKATGTALISEPSERSLFAVMLARQDGQDYVDSALARRTSLDVIPTAAGSEVVLTYSDFPNLDLSARVRGTFSNSEPLTHWTIEVRNRSGRKIERVRFPLLRALPGIGGDDDDFLVLPMAPGTLIRKPWKSWPVDYGLWPSYPGVLSAQFVTYQDASAGIYLASQDSTGYQKLLAIWKKEDGFGICHDFFLPADTGVRWRSPYPVSIGVTQGSWQDSADIYKAWAVTQPWCQRTLARRDDVPDWVRKGPLVYICSVRTYDGKGNQSGSYYPRLLQTLRLLKSQTGGPIVAMLADWENHRRFTAGDSFPVFDEKNALKTIPQITAEGFRPFFYLSGLNYTFENKGASPSRIPVPDAYLPHFVVDATTRAPKVFSFEETFFSSPWRRDSYAFCVGSPVSRLFFRKMIDESSSKLGVSVLQMDQTPSGAGEPCFSGQHDHVPGIGLYQTQGFHALLKDMREYTEQQWYRGSPGAVGIPLFTYLYHEFALAYGGDTLRIGPRETASIPWHVRGHAVNLVTGKTPAAATWLFPDQLLNADPRPIRMIRNHLQLLRAGADRYLMEGRMLHPFEISAPTLTYRFMLYDFGAPFSLDFTESSVLTSSWQAPDGGVGHVFVNLAQTKQELEVDLDTRNAPAWDLCDAFLNRSEGGDRFTPLWKSVALPRKFATVLAPEEILFVELRPAGR
jgi:hypothetical protein